MVDTTVLRAPDLNTGSASGNMGTSGNTATSGNTGLLLVCFQDVLANFRGVCVQLSVTLPVVPPWDPSNSAQVVERWFELKVGAYPTYFPSFPGPGAPRGVLTPLHAAGTHCVDEDSEACTTDALTCFCSCVAVGSIAVQSI
eukprot:654506-Prymnesium_polylepis.1